LKVFWSEIKQQDSYMGWRRKNTKSEWCGVKLWTHLHSRSNHCMGGSSHL